MSANVQGAIVIVGVLSLIDIKELFYSWKVNKFDALCWLTSFMVTAFAGAEIGIGTAVVFSFLVFLIKNAFPKIRDVGRLPGDADEYNTTALFPSATPPSIADGIIAIRPEAPLFFANAMFVRDDIEKRIIIARGDGYDPKVVILDLASATDFDASACHFIEDYQDELERDGIVLILSSPTEAALKALQRAKLIDQVGIKNIHVNIQDALARAYELTAPKTEEVA
jgi:MFS superfamily sulfate permease-like transporter